MLQSIQLKICVGREDHHNGTKDAKSEFDSFWISCSCLAAVVLINEYLFATDFRQVPMHIGAEVTESHQRLTARIFNLYSSASSFIRDEHFIFRPRAEADHRRRLDIEHTHPTFSLKCNPA